VLEAYSKRSTLSRVSTLSHLPDELTVELRNKEALSKVVMAAMRMHGLQQRKRNRTGHNSSAPGIDESQQLGEDTAADEAMKDDDFKLIYHQTFKGAALALVRTSPDSI
jgi:hypothetical protein